ncbi:MAG: class I SAM-dependent methyltransferase [Nanoarchaeota archaeon]|nr:class I SAM-dependent methyltransferase [Nanoarchaeota archaeon]
MNKKIKVSDVSNLISTCKEQIKFLENSIRNKNKKYIEKNLINAATALKILSSNMNITDFDEKIKENVENWWALRTNKKIYETIKSKSIEELYRNIVDVYETEKTRKVLFEIEEKYLLPILPNLKNKNVLDVGCGTGRCANIFVKKGAGIIGIDTSREMIEIAKRKIKNAKFKIMDARKLDFPDNCFDFVFSSLMLSHLRDWKKSVKEIIRVAKKDGCIIISDIHGAVGGGKTRSMKFLGNEKVFSINQYPIFPSDILSVAKDKCQIIDIIEIRSSEFQNKMGYFNNETYYQPTLLIMKLIKR